MNASPNIIILFSGKRKSGKDFISNHIYRRLKGHQAVQIWLSGPIKLEYAKAENLNYEELLTDSSYKEIHRLPMIKWSENLRKKDSGIFIRSALDLYKAHLFKIWIVCDIRRITDLDWFKRHYSNKIISVRISALENVRCQRGFIFTKGIDDAESECNLDSIKDWNIEFCNNNGDDHEIDKISEILLKKCLNT